MRWLRATARRSTSRPRASSAWRHCRLGDSSCHRLRTASPAPCSHSRCCSARRPASSVARSPTAHSSCTKATAWWMSTASGTPVALVTCSVPSMKRRFSSRRARWSTSTPALRVWASPSGRRQRAPTRALRSRCSASFSRRLPAVPSGAVPWALPALVQRAASALAFSSSRLPSGCLRTHCSWLRSSCQLPSLRLASLASAGAGPSSASVLRQPRLWWWLRCRNSWACRVSVALAFHSARGAMLMPPPSHWSRPVTRCRVAVPPAGVLLRCTSRSAPLAQLYRLTGTNRPTSPKRSPQCPDTEPCGRTVRQPTPPRSSRWRRLGGLRRMTLMVPAAPPNSAVGPLTISMRSMSAGASCSSEKPGGAGSPLSRIWV